MAEKELRKITQEELNDIIEKHQHWLKEDVPGWEGMRAVLNFADLTNLDFRGADLSSAIITNSAFCHANLEGARLQYADLGCSVFHWAILDGATLYKAELSGTYFRGTYMRGTDLGACSLRMAHLSSVHACGASFEMADLSKTTIDSCSLFGANFNLANADTTEIDRASFKTIDPRLMSASWILMRDDLYIPMACPDSGSFIGWKKARNHIIKLRIPEDALRSSACGRKCRCNKAEVLEIQSLDGKPTRYKTVKSNYDPSFIYRVGKTVEVEDFDNCRWNECTRGIHFFINRQEAVNY